MKQIKSQFKQLAIILISYCNKIAIRKFCYEVSTQRKPKDRSKKSVPCWFYLSEQNHDKNPQILRHLTVYWNYGGNHVDPTYTFATSKEIRLLLL
jgi:hypothetical protein